jgi:hypothetical protein
LACGVFQVIYLEPVDPCACRRYALDVDEATLQVARETSHAGVIC